MPLVTTIVPVYNVGKYLRACLDSLLEQGLREGEHEILLVDDGSTDGSGEICDEYAARCQSLIRVFHKSNGGVSSARNLGIRMARGEYVHFMDADDYMIAGGYAFLRDNFLAGGRRVDYLGFYSVTLDDVARRRFVEHNDPSGKVVFDGDVRLLYQGNKYLSLIVVGLYRRSVIADMEFDTEMRIGEDIKFNLDFALKNPGILLTDCSLYRYVIRPGSAIGNRSPRRMREAVAGYERLLTGAAAAVADYPAMTGGLETLIHCEMVPFTSRILSSDMTRSEFAALGRRLEDAGVMPLKVKFRFDTYVNLIFPPLCSSPLLRRAYRHIFLPYILPRISKG